MTTPLTSELEIEKLLTLSKTKPVLIFKHSTRCSVSDMMLKRFKRNWDDSRTDNPVFYLLDLIRYRTISDRIAQIFSVSHESPQVLLIINEQCVHTAAHSEISYDKITETLRNTTQD